MESTTLGDALFTKTQQRVMGLLFGKPDKRFYANQIVRWADMGRGTVRRELQRLMEAGILIKTEEGKQHYFQVNHDIPIYAELKGIVRKTFGVADVIRQALGPIEDNIQLALVYGSLAESSVTMSSDIDLMIVGEGLDYAAIVEHLTDVEHELGRPINPTIFSSSEYSQRINEAQSFITRVMEQPKIMIKGVIDDYREPQ